MSKNSDRRPEVIFVTHDQLSEQFDRRITDQAEIFLSNGWTVFVVCSSNQGAIVKKGNLSLLGLKNQISKNELTIFEQDLNRNNLEQNDTSVINPIELPRIQATLRSRVLIKVLRITPHRFNTIVKRNKVLSNIVWALTAQPKLPIPLWLEQATKTYLQICDSKPDLIVACDLPAAIGVMPVAMKKGISWWFDAHEIFTEQIWVQNQGELDRLRELEKRVLIECSFFSCVNYSAAKHMLSSAGIDRESIVITNALKLNERKQYFGRADRIADKKLKLIFHGGLSKNRSLFDFISSLLLCNDSNWSIDLFGWDPDPRIMKLLSDSRIKLHDPIITELIPELLHKFDCVVLPYKVIDVNTLYAMPNKLGDAVAMNLPVMYNVELVEVDNLNKDLKFGASFEYLGTPAQTASSMENALAKLRDLDTDWHKVDSVLGYQSNEIEINKLILKVTNA